MTVSEGVYFDASYIVKCSLRENGSDEVRAFLLERDVPVYSSIHGRAEVFASITRQVRDGLFPKAVMSRVLREFEQAEARGIWNWLPVTDREVNLVCELLEKNAGKKGLVLRAADAMHLASARLNGFTEIHSNDKHLLAAAPAFGLEGVDVTGR